MSYIDPNYEFYFETGIDPTGGELDAGGEAEYACLDVETANEQPSSICSLGIVWVRGQQIVDSFYSLVQPEPDYYCWQNTRVHGLSDADTRNAPVFPYVWEQVAPRLEGMCICAHNSRFDEGCIRAAFRVYQMDYPDY